MSDECARIVSQELFRSLDEIRNTVFDLVATRGGSDTYAKLLALKASNLFASNHHARERHISVTSQPLQIMLEPSNACQLGCPGCVHSANPSWRAQFDWPAKNLAVSQAWRTFKHLGPSALTAALFNYGEPLLNRQFPRIALMAKSFGLHTSASSNLSLPINAFSLVRCGLDRLVISVDGATQRTYERFRKGGKFSRVIDNINALVDARRLSDSPTPYLAWQYLTFEHNIAEVEEARDLAFTMGVDEFQVLTPFSVAADDPSVVPLRSSHEGRHLRDKAVGEISADTGWVSNIDPAAVERQWQRSSSLPNRMVDVDSAETSSPCDWLYRNVTIDAIGRVMPCCIAPKVDKNFGQLVFGSLNDELAEIANNAAFQVARSSQGSGTYHSSLPQCAGCTEAPPLTGNDDFLHLLRRIDFYGVLEETSTKKWGLQ